MALTITNTNGTIYTRISGTVLHSNSKKFTALGYSPGPSLPFLPYILFATA